MANANGIFRRVYNETNSQLATTTVTSKATSSGSTHDMAGILRAVFDDTTATVRVISV